MSGYKTSFVEQLKQNPLFLTMSGVLIGSVTEQIEGFTGIPSLVVSIFAVLLTLIPLVWALSVWLKKRKKYSKPQTKGDKIANRRRKK